MKDLPTYIFNVLVSIIGFFLVFYFTKTNAELSKIGADIVNMRIELSELKASIMSEERVREIVQQEIIKYHKK